VFRAGFILAYLWWGN